MIYLGIAAAAFFSDFFLKKHMDRKYARKVTHKRCGGKIIIEKFYNKGATMNFLSGRPGAMRVIHTASSAGEDTDKDRGFSFAWRWSR